MTWLFIALFAVSKVILKHFDKYIFCILTSLVISLRMQEILFFIRNCPQLKYVIIDSGKNVKSMKIHPCWRLNSDSYSNVITMNVSCNCLLQCTLHLIALQLQDLVYRDLS